MFIPGRTFRKIGGFNEKYISAEFDLAVHAQGYFSTGRIPDVLIRVCQHPAQWSLAEGVVLEFLREELEISEILRTRLVSIQGKLTPNEAVAILYRKFGLNYFHTAVKQLMKGNLSLASRIFSEMKSRLPLTPIAINWIRSLPERVVRLRR